MAVKISEQMSIPHPSGGMIVLQEILDENDEMPPGVRRNNVVWIRDGREIWRIKRDHELIGWSVIAAIFANKEPSSAVFSAESYDVVIYDVDFSSGLAAVVRWTK